MQHIDIVLFALFIIAIIACAIAILKFIKDYYNTPEDKSGLYDFIKVNNKIINVDRIDVISIVENKITIELIDSQPVIVLCSDNGEADDVFRQLTISLDPAQIVTDEVQ